MTDNPRTHRVGRPSLAAERRWQVLDAFLALLAERGLASITLDDVAAAAGVQRTVIRHYVGNRADLLHAATEELIDRYTRSIRAAIGSDPTTSVLIDHLFGPAWSTANTVEDKALDELFHEAARDQETRTRLRGAYQMLIDELAGAVRAERARVTAAAAQDAAYQIVALAETNGTFQRLGFPASRARAARQLARSIIDNL